MSKAERERWATLVNKKKRKQKKDAVPPTHFTATALDAHPEFTPVQIDEKHSQSSRVSSKSRDKDPKRQHVTLGYHTL